MLPNWVTNLSKTSQNQSNQTFEIKDFKGLEILEKQSFSEHTPKSKILDDSSNFQSKEKGINKVGDVYHLP